MKYEDYELGQDHRFRHSGKYMAHTRMVTLLVSAPRCSFVLSKGNDNEWWNDNRWRIYDRAPNQWPRSEIGLLSHIHLSGAHITVSLLIQSTFTLMITNE